MGYFIFNTLLFHFSQKRIGHQRGCVIADQPHTNKAMVHYEPNFMVVP
jgi:hypothetical protein